MGSKGKPFYRLVVKEKRSKRDGAYLENVGTYNPMTNPAEVNLNHDRIQYWIGVGAQPTETVASLIKNNPEQTEEEKAAAAQARTEKLEADKKAQAEVKKVETEKLAAEKAEAEKIEADRIAAEETAAKEAAEAESAEVETAETETVETETEPAAEAASETTEEKPAE